MMQHLLPVTIADGIFQEFIDSGHHDMSSKIALYGLKFIPILIIPW